MQSLLFIPNVNFRWTISRGIGFASTSKRSWNNIKVIRKVKIIASSFVSSCTWHASDWHLPSLGFLSYFSLLFQGASTWKFCINYSPVLASIVIIGTLCCLSKEFGPCHVSTHLSVHWLLYRLSCAFKLLTLSHSIHICYCWSKVILHHSLHIFFWGKP